MATLTRAQFEARKAQAGRVQSVQKTQSAPKAQKVQAPTMTRAQFNARSGGKSPVVMSRADFEKRKNSAQPESGGLWRKVGNQLIKPVASASNALEDSGKLAAYGIIKKFIDKNANFDDYAKKVGFDPIQHQKDVWTGKNKRTYSTIANEFSDAQFKGDALPAQLGRAMAKTTGYGGDFILDPLNKVKIAELTAKGIAAKKTGQLGLSAAEQANKGERALLQFGKTNILPSVGNQVLKGATKANDAIRATKYGAKAVDALATVSTSVRPSGIDRPEFKTLQDATRNFKKGTQYATQKAIEVAADIEKTLRKSGADDATRSALLHAVEKGDASLVPEGLEEVFNKATAFKKSNEEAWKAAGGATVENYGLPHVATDAVKESQPTKNIKGGGTIYSPATGQDIQRQWVKVDGKIVNLEKEGIKYDSKAGLFVKNVGKETKDGGFAPKWEPVNVEQATAKEINDALKSQGKEGIFKEDLGTSIAVGGISTGKKQAGNNFLKATADIKSDKGLEIVNSTYQRLTNDEAVAKALKVYDKVLGVWKAQVLVAPSYHVRNEVGNLWNNYLAGTSPLDYANAAKIQGQIALGKVDDATKKLVQEMEEQGVIGGSQYGKDITQTISDELGGASMNPFSQRFGVYKANRALGTGFEDNARMAHYLSKRREGYSAAEAAKSVEKFLFDYSDLTFVEQSVLKRVLPFYTWARKNIPLQLEQFVKNPGKFSGAAVAQKDVEEKISRPNEKYLSEYVKNNSPMRIRENEDGTTEYLLLGQWIPGAQAIQFLSQPQDEILRGISPMVTIPSDLINNKSFFKDSLGQDQPIEKTPGELGSFLGFDMRKKAISVLRGIRLLNEIDKLNPGEIFGGKGKPSIFQGLTENASETRGTQHSPDSTQSSRNLGFILGKTSTYDPETAKTFYDYDTQDRMNQYTQQMQNALKLGQTDLAANILKEMEQFSAEREGKPNQHIEKYNLMGDRYFQDLVKDKQAEINRDDTRKKMREMIREGLKTGSNDIIRKAVEMDPEYSKQAVKDALKEKGESQMSQKDQQLMYEIERMKTENRLKPYY